MKRYSSFMIFHIIRCYSTAKVTRLTMQVSAIKLAMILKVQPHEALNIKAKISLRSSRNVQNRYRAQALTKL